MALLCFLLDLRNIPPPLLRNLKLCLLQLANYYAISKERRANTDSTSSSQLPDRLALAYIHRIKTSPSPELKIAYTPGEKFNLRDFHHAVNNMPQDSFSLELGDPNHTTIDGGINKPHSKFSIEIQESSNQSEPGPDVLWENLFSNKALYMWCSDDVSKKVIAICMLPCNNIEALRKSLMDAADQCISVDFVMLESSCILPNDRSTKFVEKICDLENCVIRQYTPDTQLLHGLFKRWLEELKDDMEEPLQAIFHFKDAILGSSNKIACNLVATTNPIMDGFLPCQACRCHGLLTSTTTTAGKQKNWCQVSTNELEPSDIVENSIRVGKDNILFLPSFGCGSSMERATSHLSFNVIERTSLASLDEGAIMGASYRVYPSSSEDEIGLDASNALDQNIQIFKGLCDVLFNLDEGLVCSSMRNTETMRDASFTCYYLLLPSKKGQMLLRRLAGSEETIPIPDKSRTSDFSVPKEIENSIQASLSKIPVKEYNPLEHERGFHTKLNGLVKESLQFRFVAPVCPKAGQKPNILKLLPSSMPNNITAKEYTIPSPIIKDWEQLVVLDDDDKSTKSLSMNLKLKSEPTNQFLSQSKPMDEKTTRILERLEPPKAKRQQKNDSSSLSVSGVVGQMKKPLLPFDSNSKLNPTQSQPLRPNFQRMKKRQKT